MNKQRNAALIMALAFALSASPAMAKKERDFSGKSASPDPVVQTTSGSTHEMKGESVTRDGMSDHQADFKKDSPAKDDPVVRSDGHPIPQPQGGEDIKNNDISSGR